ncbi:MAG: methylmalonyl Co-A mutase-associated GTPase MeaB [Deltaproteobacteria bacterium]|jgi:LAO/AO transport system kinase|nr:methylmalonyl Co-A mutase-associated GTPase MeaB [Deltaproteobacteria bacterium]MBT6499462.1 methylmalonyl Co-A mutase-associated GTPase MeaB [Deltaproteobacteria bacterium]
MNVSELSKKILEGDIRSASRAIRNIEDGVASKKQLIKHIFPHTGNAHIAGFTGSPGAGKSTIIDELIAHYRGREDKSIGVMAVDPTSPYTGGAILGDRIRMQRHAEDPNVFLRSLATRGALGGLSTAVGDAVHIMDAMGKDKIVIETVGTGQQEVEIMNYAHTVIVVLVPGMGDDIQVIKAGIMEIGDIFVINKADRDGSQKLYNGIKNMLDMANFKDGEWRPPVLMLESVQNLAKFSSEVENVAENMDAHYHYLVDKDSLSDRVRHNAKHEMICALKEAILNPVLNELIESGKFERMVDQLISKASDPYSLAEEIAGR